jgi:hypothetical protein
MSHLDRILGRMMVWHAEDSDVCERKGTGGCSILRGKEESQFDFKWEAVHEISCADHISEPGAITNRRVVRPGGDQEARYFL